MVGVVFPLVALLTPPLTHSRFACLCFCVWCLGLAYFYAAIIGHELFGKYTIKSHVDTPLAAAPGKPWRLFHALKPS